MLYEIEPLIDAVNEKLRVHGYLQQKKILNKEEL